jgi:hypothetical protein
MTFQAQPAQVFSALQEAAGRTGFRYLSGDVSRGSAMFTSGMSLLMFGDKVSARWKQVAPGTVQVTLSSAQFGGVGWWGRSGRGVDRLSDELGVILPHTG